MGKFKKYLEKRESNIIKTGKNINPNFWEEFIMVLNNLEGISELLNVPKHKILSWRERIRKKISNEKEEIKINKKKKIIKTGGI